MAKVFFIDHVQRNVTLVKTYRVEAETFEEAIALHDADWENLEGTQEWGPEVSHMVDGLKDGWNLRSEEDE